MASLWTRLRIRAETASIRLRVWIRILIAAGAFLVIALGVNGLFFPQWLSFIPGATPPTVVENLAQSGADVVAGLSMPPSVLILVGVALFALSYKV